jgi:hypothetical protein
MNKTELTELLRQNICSVTFTKVDGTVRTMPCTLDPAIVPPVPEPKVLAEGSEPRVKKPNDAVFSVWCTDAAGWRSFRWDNFISAEVLPAENTQ